MSREIINLVIAPYVWQRCKPEELETTIKKLRRKVPKWVASYNVLVYETDDLTVEVNECGKILKEPGATCKLAQELPVKRIATKRVF